jgi:hypothetical protein
VETVVVVMVIRPARDSRRPLTMEYSAVTVLAMMLPMTLVQEWVKCTW